MTLLKNLQISDFKVRSSHMAADRRPMLATPRGEHKEEVGLLAACLPAGNYCRGH